jgi:hypothetical protein
VSEDDLAALLRTQGCEMLAMRDRIAELESRLADALEQLDREAAKKDRSWIARTNKRLSKS